jgi:protein involved in plasmid replication-relaxation
MSIYRFMNAVDVAHCLFSPASLTYVRSILTRLAGGGDYKERECLYRVPLQSGKAGNPERVFTLGSAGLAVVRSLGIPVEWYYRPSKTERLQSGYLRHQLLLTRFVVCARRFARESPDFSLVDVRLCYELEGQRGKRGAETVVPDAWLHFERGANSERYPVLVEIDRGSEYQERLKNHVKGRLEFYRSGEYERVFGTPAVIIAYATTSDIEEHAETRRKTMCAWTMEVLAELEIENWAGIFRFTSALDYTRLYEQGQTLFTSPVWYRPDAPSTPLPLLGS